MSLHPRHLCWLLLASLFGCQHLPDRTSTNQPTSKTIEPTEKLTPLPSPYASSPALNTNLSPTSRKTVSLSSKPVDFSTASLYVLNHSDKLLAAQSALRAKQLQADALKNLRHPIVFVNGSAGRYNAEHDLSTEDLRNRLHNHIEEISTSSLAGKLPSDLQNLLGKLPSTNMLPSEIHLKKQDNFSSVNIGALLPLYTGGRIDAAQQFAQGRVDLQSGELAETEEALQTLLVNRYFLVQLAKNVVAVREHARQAVKTHDHAAQRMLDVGLISQVERLQGKTALADAEFELKKAKDNLRLAQRALDSLLQSKDVFPSSALFVNRKPLDPLDTFQQKAREHYPAFTKLAAKKKQAQAMKTSNDAAWKPSVSAFGAHQLNNSGKNWVVGLGARWTLNSNINRAKMQQATGATLAQIDSVQRQAEHDVALLVEKSWLAVTDAVARFDSLAEKQALAKEVVRLRTAGFREGINTVIEVNDAEANLAMTKTERANAAYDYVNALATLLAAVGEPEKFSLYLANADARIDEDNNR